MYLPIFVLLFINRNKEYKYNNEKESKKHRDEG